MPAMPGQPAATVGSLTAHGGVVTTGAPNVLINGQPAARQGDLHICPLCSPTPHVGGPILNGVPSVLIAGQPMATVNSLATCASPAADVIMQGAPNVLVGPGGPLVEFEAGCTVMFEPRCTVEFGGPGASAGAAAAQGAQASAQAAQQGSIEATEEAEPAARIRYVDRGGEPISGPRYKHAGRGEETQSALRLHGEVRRSGKAGEGLQETTPYGVAGARWSKPEARVGEEVKIEAKAFGFEDGTSANVLIYRREGGSDVLEAALDSEVSGGKVEAAWTYAYDEGAYAARRAAAAGEKLRVHMPVYVAKVHVHPETTATEALSFQDWIETNVTEERTGEPMAQARYRVRLASGEIRTGTTDAAGTLRENDVPPGDHQLLSVHQKRRT